jgi:major type 1 subunit fimbrin (pilin)
MQLSYVRSLIVKRIALALATTVPAMAFAASSNTITFKGQVAAQTCTVSINGNEGNPVVLMPTVSARDLAEQGSSAGETTFTIEVSGCAVRHGDTTIKTAFQGDRVTGAGHLGNAGTASNVQVQLLNGAGGSVVRLDGLTSVPGLKLNSGASSASHDFAVRYVSEEGLAKAGTVSATAQYALDYL